MSSVRCTARPKIDRPARRFGRPVGARDAELLAQALGDGFDGRRPFAQALAAYQEERDRQTMPMYDFTTDLAALKPAPPEARVLFRALADRPDE